MTCSGFCVDENADAICSTVLLVCIEIRFGGCLRQISQSTTGSPYDGIVRHPVPPQPSTLVRGVNGKIVSTLKDGKSPMPNTAVSNPAGGTRLIPTVIRFHARNWLAATK